MKKNFIEFKNFIKGKNTAVLGIGVSNKPLIRFLVDLGAKVTAFDRKNSEDLKEECDEFKTLGVNLVLGEDYLDNLSGFEVIFKTPSMRMDLPHLVKAHQEGAYITSEMEEFVKYCPAKVYGITGSDGKTTTTTIISKMLQEEGYNVYVGGNIGTPLFSCIEEINTEDRVVLELSSFQLMSMDVSPDICIITNLSPNHLDIHKDMEEYIEAKKNIFKFGDENQLVVLNMDNTITCNMQKEIKGSISLFSSKTQDGVKAYLKDDVLFLEDKPVVNSNDIVIKGMHNVENYLAAFCAVSSEVSISNMKKVCENFKGVSHRMEFVRELNGVKYFNDSIASSPTRTLAGLKAFDKKVILLAGGYDKNIPFEVLAKEGEDYIKILILMGDTKEKIKEAFVRVLGQRVENIEIYMVGDLEEGVRLAKDKGTWGDIVTLSPACASFDAFKNFEVRGNKFKEYVSNLF